MQRSPDAGIWSPATRRMERPDAVKNWGRLGAWDQVGVKDLTRIEELLNRFVDAKVESASREEVAL